MCLKYFYKGHIELDLTIASMWGNHKSGKGCH